MSVKRAILSQPVYRLRGTGSLEFSNTRRRQQSSYSFDRINLPWFLVKSWGLKSIRKYCLKLDDEFGKNEFNVGFQVNFVKFFLFSRATGHESEVNIGHLSPNCKSTSSAEKWRSEKQAGLAGVAILSDPVSWWTSGLTNFTAYVYVWGLAIWQTPFREWVEMWVQQMSQPRSSAGNWRSVVEQVASPHKSLLHNDLQVSGISEIEIQFDGRINEQHEKVTTSKISPHFQAR